MTLTTRFSLKPLPTAPQPPPPSRLARNLALAYLVERKIEAGEVKNYSAAARLLGLSRGRITQICSLRWLAPGVQEGILMGKVRGSEMSMRTLVEP